MSEERIGLSDVVSDLIKDATDSDATDSSEKSGQPGTPERSAEESTPAPDPIRGPQTHDPRE